MSALLLTSTVSACEKDADAASVEPPATVVRPTSANQARPAGAPVLSLPLACIPGETCEIQNYVDRDPTGGSLDYRCGSATYDGHSGVDFRLPDMTHQRRGVSVLAAADGVVARVRDGAADVSVHAPGAPSVEGQECGNGVVVDHGEGWSTQYCHMARGSIGVRPGETVRAGAPLGQVGLSGNTEYPHLHLTVRHDGAVVDPFDTEERAGPSRCGSATTSLWADPVGSALRYQDGAVLNAGFSRAPVDMAGIEAGEVTAPDRGAPALIAYVRAIDLQAGDRQRLALTDPRGVVQAETLSDALPRSQAQRLLFVGKRRPSSGWAAGIYRAQYSIERGGTIVLVHDFVVQLN